MLNGLDEVVAAETVLSDVDGAGGTLIIRGFPLAALAGRVPFEATIGLLLDGFFEDLQALLRQVHKKAAAVGRVRQALHVSCFTESIDLFSDGAGGHRSPQALPRSLG